MYYLSEGLLVTINILEVIKESRGTILGPVRHRKGLVLILEYDERSDSKGEETMFLVMTKIVMTPLYPNKVRDEV